MAFVVFEGLDGAGKSTLIQGVESALRAQKLAFLTTREPGGTNLGDELRQILIRTGSEAPTARCEALLYQAGRAQHVETKIRPALTRGEWVLCDRFAASSIAFQSGGRGLDRAQIDWLNAFSTEGLQPDLTILLDLTVEESQRRLKNRSEKLDRFEQEKQDFHSAVRQNYLQLANAQSSSWLVLDAGQKADQLLKLTLTELKRRQWLL